MAGNAGGVLEQIVQQFDGIAHRVQGIASASQQQFSTSEEINRNVSEINDLAQGIQQRIQDANVSIKDVSHMANSLSELVEDFHSERRMFPRIDLEAEGARIMATLHKSGRDWSVNLFDLSQGGARLAIPEGEVDLLKTGDTVMVQVSLASKSWALDNIPCTIRWVGGGRFGAQFHEPLEIGEDDLRRILLG
jgi:hypothetical protein